MIVRDKPLFRTLARLPRPLLAAALQTIEAIERDYPNLPGPNDVTFLAPPAAPRWRRRVGASPWWVVYTFSAASQTLILRTVNDLG
ncbi:MAG: hypothetical protein R3A52_01590 [Polyangiales bacterium]